MALHAIYLLKDEHGVPRYVGVSRDPQDRYKRHLRETRKRTHRERWVASMIERGLKPEMEIVEWSEDWDEAEKRWVSKMRSEGYPLTNGNDGGLTMHQTRGKADTYPHYRRMMHFIGLSIRGGKHYKPSGEAREKLIRAKQALQNARKVALRNGTMHLLERRIAESRERTSAYNSHS